MNRRLQFYAFLFITAMFVLQSACGYGQPKKFSDLKNASPAQRAEFQTKLMTTKLKLDEAQLKKVQGINLKYAEKFQPIIKSNDSRFSKLQQATALQKEKDLELQAIFSKVQYNEYLAFEQQLRKKLRAAFKK